MRWQWIPNLSLILFTTWGSWIRRLDTCRRSRSCQEGGPGTYCTPSRSCPVEGPGTPCSRNKSCPGGGPGTSYSRSRNCQGGGPGTSCSRSCPGEVPGTSCSRSRSCPGGGSDKIRWPRSVKFKFCRVGNSIFGLLCKSLVFWQKKANCSSRSF